MTLPLPPDKIRVAKDTVLFRQGDPGQEMFVIAAGGIRLTLGSNGYETHIATLGPGEFFGELSLLTGAPRTATARAIEDSVLLVISRDVFATMLQDDLELVSGMLHEIGERLSFANRPRQRQAERLGHIRVAVAGLREVLGRRHDLPHACAIDALASAVGVKPEAARNTVEALAQAGVGTVEGDRWRFETWEDIERLVDALGRYAGPEH